VADHRWLGAFLRNGNFRGSCSCGLAFLSSTRTGAREAHASHREPESKEPA
jgi:hypothetical protein